MTVQFREKKAQDGRSSFPETLRFGDRADLQTGTDGTYRTPKAICRKNREYRVQVYVEGFFGGKTGWEPADGVERITFPDLVLRPRPTRRLIEGRVVDRGGRGVAAVTVFQPTDSPRRNGDYR